jgi:hypothetical protein
MARIRTVKPEFFKHEDLYILEKDEKLPLRIAFVGLWCVADREGRFKWKPNQIKLDVLPYDNCDFSRVLDALATHGFVEQYLADDEKLYGFIPSFSNHQVINNRESESVIPSPFDASVTRDPHGLSKNKGKGKEGKGREGKGNGKPKAENYEDYPEFLEFWSAYPRKDGKNNAFVSWVKNSPNIDIVLNTLNWQRLTPQWLKEDGQYIPLAATYLNAKRWEDEPSADMLGEPF